MAGLGRTTRSASTCRARCKPAGNDAEAQNRLEDQVEDDARHLAQAADAEMGVPPPADAPPPSLPPSPPGDDAEGAPEVAVGDPVMQESIEEMACRSTGASRTRTHRGARSPGLSDFLSQTQQQPEEPKDELSIEERMKNVEDNMAKIQKEACESLHWTSRRAPARLPRRGPPTPLPSWDSEAEIAERMRKQKEQDEDGHIIGEMPEDLRRGAAGATAARDGCMCPVSATRATSTTARTAATCRSRSRSRSQTTRRRSSRSPRTT